MSAKEMFIDHLEKQIEEDKQIIEMIKSLNKELKQDNDIAEINPTEYYYIDEHNNIWEDSYDMNQYYAEENHILDDNRPDYVYEEAEEVLGSELIENIKNGTEYTIMRGK